LRIEYLETVEGIEPWQLAGFFEGWPNPPSADTHLRMLRSSAHIVLAIDPASNRVVGFVTAISDGVLSAFIPLLEVLPEYRGRGIGSELVRRIITALDGLYMIDLICDDDLVPFYERFGLRRASAMIKRNYARQSGAEGR
jgi:ribosomal protein S18 acetylase RimI-like enzyme